jgi:EAL domain-containing protein (putative c-di-GMP-specific phosphodiesterase class I)
MTVNKRSKGIADVALQREREAKGKKLQRRLKDPTTKLRGIAEFLIEAFDADGAVLLQRDQMREWKSLSCKGLDADFIDALPQSLKNRLPSEVFEGKSSQLLVKGVVSQRGGAKEQYWALWAPIKHKGLLLGVMAVFRNPPDFLTSERDILSACAEVVAERLVPAGKKPEGAMPLKNAKEQKNEMKRIIETEDISFEFQPIVSLWTGEIAGYEALARGPRDSSLASPLKMFEWAKNIGRTTELASLCVEVALKSAKEVGLPANTFLSINITPALLRNTSLLRSQLKQHKGWLKPWCTVLEVTEIPGDGKEICKNAADLIVHGYSLAADDQGTQYGNDQRLINVMPRWIKVPCETIGRLKSTGVSHLVRRYVDFAQSYGGTVIAEGIETADELRQCKDLGIGFVQGFGIAKPSPVFIHSLSPRDPDIDRLLR